MEMVALPENTGFCGAVNLGFEMTTTPYAILLNNDTEAEPHFVEELLKGIRQSERIFSCGAQMLDFKQRELLDNAGDLYTLPGWAVARGKADLPQIMENRRMFFPVVEERSSTGCPC